MLVHAAGENAALQLLYVANCGICGHHLWALKLRQLGDTKSWLGCETRFAEMQIAREVTVMAAMIIILMMMQGNCIKDGH